MFISEVVKRSCAVIEGLWEVRQKGRPRQQKRCFKPVTVSALLRILRLFKFDGFENKMEPYNRIGTNNFIIGQLSFTFYLLDLAKRSNIFNEHCVWLTQRWVAKRPNNSDVPPFQWPPSLFYACMQVQHHAKCCFLLFAFFRTRGVYWSRPLNDQTFPSL